MGTPIDCGKLSDTELLARLRRAAGQEHLSLVDLLCYLAEAERRDIALKEGYSSSFEFCVKSLGYSEEEAYRRIHAMRAARKYPAVYAYLADGLLSLTTVSRLEPHLTLENHAELLARAQGKTTRELELILAELEPAQPRPDRIHAVGAGSCARVVAHEEPAASDAPLLQAAAAAEAPCAPMPDRTPEPEPAPPPARRLRVAFDCGETLIAKLERARELLRHKFPAGRCEEIVEAALDALLDRRDMLRGPVARKPAARSDGQAAGRHIPKWVRVAVWRRDEGRCAFVSASGRRCAERGGLEYDHIVPFALGGPSDNPANIRLACRGHNTLAAKERFGAEAVGAHRQGVPSSEPAR